MNWRKKLGEPQAYLYCLPALVPYTIFWLAPMGYVMYLSFMEWDFINPVKEFVGIENYVKLFQDQKFYKALRVSLLFALGNVIPCLAGGLLLALLLHSGIKGLAIYRTLIFLPWVTPMVAVSIVWAWIFEPRVGLANAVLEFFGFAGLEWTHSSKTALLAVLIVTVWKGLGWTMVFYLVALQNIPEHLYEAAMLEGANKFQQLIKITLPLVSPTTFFLFLITTIDSVQAYDQINVLTQGGPAGATRTLLYLYYESAFQRFEVGEASSVAVVMIVILAIISSLSMYVSRRRIHYV